MTSQRYGVTLVTGRTINQGITKELGKFSKEYQEIASTCYIDPTDLIAFRIIEHSNVLVSTIHGSVVLKAKKSMETPHSGIIYIPNGPWANILVDPDSQGVGMPTLKGISAEIEPSANKRVLTLTEILATFYKKFFPSKISKNRPPVESAEKSLN